MIDKKTLTTIATLIIFEISVFFTLNDNEIVNRAITIDVFNAKTQNESKIEMFIDDEEHVQSNSKIIMKSC